MYPQDKKLFIATLLFALIINTMSASLSEAGMMEVMKEGLPYSSMLQNMAKAGNLSGVEGLAIKIENDWYVKSKFGYAQLMLVVCNALERLDFGDKRQYEFKKQYAEAVLKKLEGYEVPIRIELELVSHTKKNIEHIKNASQDTDWSQQRNKLAKFHFLVWGRLDKLIDKNWDPSIPKPYPPAPPNGLDEHTVNAYPNSISPELRAEYEAQCEEYRQNLRDYNKQLKLQNLGNKFSPELQEYILNLYSYPSFESTILQQDIEKHIEDNGVRTTMLEAVSNLYRLKEELKQEDSLPVSQEQPQPIVDVNRPVVDVNELLNWIETIRLDETLQETIDANQWQEIIDSIKAEQ